MHNERGDLKTAPLAVRTNSIAADIRTQFPTLVKRRISTHSDMVTPIVDCTTIVGLGSLIKRRDIGVEISYGSGGFCVLLKTSNGIYNGYSWDLSDAIEKAVTNMNEQSVKSILEDYVADDFDDTPTQPDIRIDKIK